MRALLFIPALLLAACSPAPETEVRLALEPGPTPTPAEDPWLSRFRQVHGGTFDPGSRVDRQKMAALKGETPAPASASAPPVAATVKDSLTVREEILAVARKLVGQTETGGSNRSPLIDKMNRLTGVALGSPYCASFNAWCYSEADAPGKWPKSAWSPDWVRSPTWTSAKGGKTPRAADAFGIWYASKGRIAHTGLVESWGASSAVTLEGNTSPSAEFGAATDRDGDGIWRKRRLVRQIHSVRSWLSETDVLGSF